METRPGVPQNGGNGPPTVETGVLLIGRGVAYRKTDETDLLRSKRGSCSSGVAYRKTGLHGILFISTVDLLQPPRATVDLLQPPRAPIHPASTACYSTSYCSTTPPPSTVHPSLHTTGSCSTTPPRAPLHRLLFIQPSTTPRGPILPEGTPPLTVHPTPPPPERSLYIPEAASIGLS